MGCCDIHLSAHLEKQNVFTIHTAHGYTAFTAYCDAVSWDPYLHDERPDCSPYNLDVFSRPEVTHSATPSPLHLYPPPYGETTPSDLGIQESEGATYVIRGPDSERDT